MITIVEPKEHIAKLWGKQKVKQNETYRLMKYVLRVNHDGKALLHNVVTGQLVALEPFEVELLDCVNLKKGCYPQIDQLVTDHYLVPDTFNEHNSVVQMREVLRKLDSGKAKDILNYEILPTTACNARCYYCFEHELKPLTMTKGTADQVVEFISDHYVEGQKVYINWFGGEPTVASKRIDQISAGLNSKVIPFFSTMISNGYLFDEDMADRAKDCWHLESVQISIDGTEKNTNRIKAFVDDDQNPYQRILNNISILLKHNIAVSLRMNFDIDNYTDFSMLLQEVNDRFPKAKRLQVYAHPVLGEYPDSEGVIHHGSDEWIANSNNDLNMLAKNAGLRRPSFGLPHMAFKGCSADDSSWMVISPRGSFVRCLEQLGDDQIIGNVWDGLTNADLVKSWKILADYPKCRECVLFPRCVRLINCSGRDRCHGKEEWVYDSKNAIIRAYQNRIERTNEL